jgi:hypothetical protein
MVHNFLLLIWMRIRPKWLPPRFAYPDGKRWKTIKPQVVIRRLILHPKYSTLAYDRAVNEFDETAIRNIAIVVRHAFSIRERDEINCLAILGSFFLWLKLVKHRLKVATR